MVTNSCARLSKTPRKTLEIAGHLSPPPPPPPPPPGDYTCMKSIKHLPPNVHRSLHSSVVLSDLPRVVEELIYNSIDAGASKIDILVNVKACYVKVEDDGSGITRDELVILGEKYATSKFHDVAVDGEPSSGSYGFKGETLGSLSDISVVEIRTKARGRPNSYCKIIKGSKCLHLGIDDQREVVGTTVIVRDLFYNQPVRRKYMQSSHKRELHCVKKRILRIAFIHPQVSFRLLDIDSEDELLCTVPSSSPLPLVSDSFGNDVSSCLHEIASSYKDWVLSGLISGPTDAFSTKAFQYLYINSRFVDRSPIHNMLNSLATSLQSSMVKKSEDIDLQSRKRQKTIGYPAYLLNFYCPRSSYDLQYEPSKTVVEFKDWHTVLLFFEQTITNYWKNHVLQLPKEIAADDRTRAPLKIKGKSNLGFLKRCSAPKKESPADLYQRSPQQNAVKHGNVDSSTATVHKEPHNFSMDLERCTWNIDLTDWVCDALPHLGCAARNDLELGNNQMHSPNDDGCQWLDSSPLQLDPAFWKRRRTEGIFCGNGHSGNFGMLEDVKTESLSADAREFEKNAPEIGIQEHYFGAFNRRSRMNCDFLQNKIITKSQNSDYGSFGFEFDKLSEDCVLDEVSEAVAGISYPEMSQSSDGFYHEGGTSSKGIHSIVKRCTRKKKSRIATDCDDTCTTAKRNFHDMQEALENDDMDGSSIKHMLSILSHPFSLADVPCGHTWTDLESHKRSSKSFDNWNCEKMSPDLRFSLDRFNEDSPLIRGKTQRFDNFNNDTQLFSKFNHDKQKAFDCFFNESISKDAQISWESEVTAGSPFDCSPEKSVMDCCLNSASSQVADRSMFVEDLNQHYFRCGRTVQLCKGRSRRSLSAPPFYKGKCKFSQLNESLTKLTGKDDKDLSGKSSPDSTCLPVDISHLNATQPTPETDSCECSELNLSASMQVNVKAHEDTCSYELEDATQITKWRDGWDQRAVLELTHGPLLCNDDVLSTSSGPLHVSGGSLVPESIDKDCFEEARVLLQIDKKFIPVMSGETLLIVDQHAADERIRLEELRNKVLSDEGQVITYLDSEVDLALPEMGFQLFQKYAEQIQKWGWISNNCSTSSEPFKKNMNIMRRQSRLVTLVAVPCILGINLTGKDLMEYIEQLVETDGSSTVPPAVLRILNFKACRGAIMFGDALLPSECSLIIEELKATSLCFQCAHGRPTTVPIVNTASLHEELARLEMLKGHGSETWHGLSYQVPSLERARTRLQRLKRLRCRG